MMNVLVTGHAGYIGSVMVPFLQSAGHAVSGLDTGYFSEDVHGPSLEKVLRKDIRDVRVEDLIGYDAIIHLAALSNDPMGELNESWTYEINYEATVNLAKLAKEAGVSRFLYSSSCSVYGMASEDALRYMSYSQVLWDLFGKKQRKAADVIYMNTYRVLEDIGREDYQVKVCIEDFSKESICA